MIRKIKNATLILASTCLFACNGTETDRSNDIHLDDSLVSQEQTTPTDEQFHEEGLPDNIVGTYTGTLPCADCEGIETTIVINKDGSFKKSDQYITKKDIEQSLFKDKGMIDWNPKDSIITLISTVEVSKLEYKVGKDEINALNIDGNEVTGQLADKFTLTKE